LVLLIVAICLAPLFSFLWIQKSRLMFVRLTVSPGSPGDEFRPRVVEDASTPFVGGKVYDIDASGSEVKFPAGSLQRFGELGISLVSVTDTKGNQYEPYEGIHVQLEKNSVV
jgi:hypothetical protein